MRFKFRISELIKEKELRDGKLYNYSRISKATGIHAGRVKAYVENDLVRFDAKTIEAFLIFFDCSICDLFEDVDEPQ